MHIMYVDESGDPGTAAGSSDHFILTGLIVDQKDWDKFYERLKTFRKSLRVKYHLKAQTEVHAVELIRVNKIKEYRTIRKKDRIQILKDYCSQIPIIFDTGHIINVCLKISDFDPATDIFQLAWNRLIQRYDTFLKKVPHDYGIIISDDTDSLKLMRLQRRMKVYNPIPSSLTPPYYNSPVSNVLEDTLSKKAIIRISFNLPMLLLIAYIEKNISRAV